VYSEADLIEVSAEGTAQRGSDNSNFTKASADWPVSPSSGMRLGPIPRVATSQLKFSGRR